MKGYLLLTMGRSGSYWLTSLANSTGKMGKSEEWLDYQHLAKPYHSFSSDDFFEHVLQQASTDNGHFAIKIFPGHMTKIQRDFGFDFVARCLKEHDVKIIVLTRRDRIGQAISAVRARQTGQWKSTKKTGQKNTYDFHAICQQFFVTGQSASFWENYLSLNEIPFDAIVYEDLLPDPVPFLKSLADWMEVDEPDNWETELTVQRDKTTDEWRTQFTRDLAEKGIMQGYAIKSWTKYPVQRLNYEIRHFLRFKVFWWQ